MAEERIDEPGRDLASSVDGQRTLENDETVLERFAVVAFEVTLEQSPRLGCERAFPSRRFVVECDPASLVGPGEVHVSRMRAEQNRRELTQHREEPTQRTSPSGSQRATTCRRRESSPT